MTKRLVLSLALALSAQAWAKPVTVTVTPQNLSETSNQVRAVFSDKVVALSAKPPADVFAVACTPAQQGVAQWEDEKSWTFDFRTKLYANKLPGGTRCTVTLKDDFKKLKNVAGKTAFAFQVDGPNIISIYPGETDGKSREQIAEDQVFALGLDTPTVEDSILKNVKLKVDGLASPLQVRIVSEAEKLRYMKSTDFPEYKFNKDLPVVMVKAAGALPQDKKVSLIWGAGVQAEGGLARQRDLVIPFETRPLLTANFSCNRENANADCSPFSDMELTFTAPIAMDLAKQIELVSLDGKRHIKAQIDADNKGDSTISQITFPALVQEKQQFRLVLPKDIKDDAGRPLANADAFPKLVVKTAEFPPLAKFASDFGLIEANQTPVLLPATLRNLEAQVIGQKFAPTSVEGSSVKVDAANFASVVQWMKKLDKKASSARSYEDRDRSVFPKGTKSNNFNIPTKNNGKAFEVVGIPLDGPGFYVVELQSKLLAKSLLGKDSTMYVPTGALVTNMVVHSKWGVENSLFWVTSLDNGAPVANAMVAVHDCSGKAVWSAQTDAQGRAVLDGDLKKKVDLQACSDRNGDDYSRYNSGFFVSAQAGNDFTFTHSSWQDGIETWRFDNLETASPEYAGNNRLATSVLDRTLVRAGEKKPIGMKHFLRVPYSKGFKALPTNQLPSQVVYEHVDTGTKYTDNAKLKWDANGTAVSEFAVPKDAKLGLYQVSLQNGDDSYQTASFQVLEFKIPLMKGKIDFPPQKQQQLVAPGKLDAQLSVTYQDGGPAINHPVTFRYSVNRDGWLTFQDLGYTYNFGREKVVEKEGRTDSGEEVNVETHEVPTRLNAKGSAVVTIPGLSGFDSPRSVTAQLEFIDKNSEAQNVARTITVYPANRLVAVNSENAYGSEKKIRFTAAVVDVKGQPIAGATPKLELFENQTFTHRTRMVGGYYSSESFTSIKRVKDQSAFKCDGQTNKKGLVHCEVVAPDSGTYIVQAAITDNEGHTAYGSDNVYVRGSKRAWFPADNNDRMDLIPEKKDVDAGQTAKLQVQMPFSEATVLVTVEREGIVDSFVKTISTTNPVIEVPIKPEYAPNVFVSAMAVRGRVTGSGAEETATVDLGKPAYKLGLTQLNVNWKPNTLKVAVKPSKGIYQPRENATINVAISTPDGKPAANAEFALAVIDEGLLQLAKNRTWNLLKEMMGRRSLSVETATAQMQVVGKRHYGMKAKPTGGDGGQAPSREIFDTQVYWQARVKTDASGNAAVTFPMNDSTSEFRVVAVAHAGLGRFGTGESKVITQKDVIVDTAMGTVSRNGDALAAEFNVRNTTKSSKTLTLSGSVTYTYADGRTETVALQDKQVTLEAQGAESVNLGQHVVPDGVVKSQYKVSVSDENKQVVDSINVPAQEVKPAVLPRTWMAQLSRIDAKFTPVAVELPENALKDQGGVVVSLKRSLTDGLDTVSRYYNNYPFMSLEYQASRAVALNLANEWNDVMKTLPSYLDASGLVKYYPSSTQGSDVLTAYLLSLSANARAIQSQSFVIPSEAKDKMIDGLIAFVQGRSRGTDRGQTQVDIYIRRLNAIEALARNGKAEAAWLTSLPKVAPEQIPTSTLIDQLSIYTRVNAADRKAKLAQASEALSNRLTRFGTGERIQDSTSRPWYSMTSSDSDQLELILTLSQSTALRQAWAQHLPLLMNAAVGMMKRGSWDMTVANATGILAIKSFAKYVEPEGNVTGDTKIALDGIASSCDNGGENCKLFSWGTEGNETGGRLTLGWPSTGAHKVDIAHVGTGAPWATVAVNAAIPLTSKVEQHIAVTKTITPQKDVYQKNDVVEVALQIKPQADMPYVSIMDPIPAGAKILGSGLDNDSNGGPQNSGWHWPEYQELAYDAYRASYTTISPEGMTVKYKVQLNNVGEFKLPATRVEAVYAPENFAEVPNASVKVVAPKN